MLQLAIIAVSVATQCSLRGSVFTGVNNSRRVYVSHSYRSYLYMVRITGIAISWSRIALSVLLTLSPMSYKMVQLVTAKSRNQLLQCHATYV